VGALRRRKGKGRGARRGINKRARTRRQFPAKFLLRDCVCGPQLRNPAIFTCRAVPLWHSSNQLSVLPLMSRPPFANVCAKQRRALLDKGSFWKLCEYAPSIRPAGFSSIAVCAAPLKPASFLQRYPPPPPPVIECGIKRAACRLKSVADARARYQLNFYARRPRRTLSCDNGCPSRSIA